MANFDKNIETVIYVLEDGKAPAFEEVLFSVAGANKVNIDRLNELLKVRKPGYHYHRHAYIDVSKKPDFTKVF